jgi:hypothetical protein
MLLIIQQVLCQNQHCIAPAGQVADSVRCEPRHWSNNEMIGRVAGSQAGQLSAASAADEALEAFTAIARQQGDE